MWCGGPLDARIRILTNVAAIQADGYDPKKSKVSQETMETWRASGVSGNLLEVPGVGPAAVRIFLEDKDPMTRITNTYQLFGQYLMLKGPDTEDKKVTTSELNHKFWFWLKMKGIKSHRSAIVMAVAEKVASFFPCFYDANAIGEDESDDEE